MIRKAKDPEKQRVLYNNWKLKILLLLLTKKSNKYSVLFGGREVVVKVGHDILQSDDLTFHNVLSRLDVVKIV